MPTAFILGSDEYHTQAGNAISLVCIIENVSVDVVSLIIAKISIQRVLPVMQSRNQMSLGKKPSENLFFSSPAPMTKIHYPSSET